MLFLKKMPVCARSYPGNFKAQGRGRLFPHPLLLKYRFLKWGKLILTSSPFFMGVLEYIHRSFWAWQDLGEFYEYAPLKTRRPKAGRDLVVNVI